MTALVADPGSSIEYSRSGTATLPSHTPSPDEADDVLFREQFRRQIQRKIEARMKYGFYRVSRPGLDKPTSRVFPSTPAYREWCVANLPAYRGYQPAPRNERSLAVQPAAGAGSRQGVRRGGGRLSVYWKKSNAILLGFPGTTQAVDVFPAKDADNGHRIVDAVRQLGDSGYQPPTYRPASLTRIRLNPLANARRVAVTLIGGSE